jgi:DNA-binding MarR family transcriptional regulator
MTNRVDRLEARGFVERHRSPDDRRGVVVRLTQAGRTRADEALAGLLVGEAAMLAALPPQQRPALADLLRVLVRPFEAEDAR